VPNTVTREDALIPATGLGGRMVGIPGPEGAADNSGAATSARRAAQAHSADLNIEGDTHERIQGAQVDE